jgi:hypothetical protein
VSPAFGSPFIHPLALNKLKVIDEVGMEFEQRLQVLAGFVFIAIPAPIKAFFDGAIPYRTVFSFPTASLPADRPALQSAYSLKNLNKTWIIFKDCVRLRPVCLSGL